ncbi:hypothetical protein [Streptomyces sp. YGL11-2]|uniref:hypothetical protein n=1 Tax=Streptomyces sp. YGL11-2 TaxID=3414028 RepID=UPI003CF2B938
MALIEEARVAYELLDRIQLAETPAGPDTAGPPVHNQLPIRGSAPTRTQLVFDAECRDWPMPVIVHRVRGPTRRLSAAGRTVGTATCVEDVVALLSANRLEPDYEDPRSGIVIEWHGGGPNVWPAPLPPTPVPSAQDPRTGW